MICEKSPENLNLFINGLFHVVILFTILTVFFFLYVSKLAQSKFEKELGLIISKNITESLSMADKDNFLKSNLKKDYFQRFIPYFSNPSKSTTVQNNWVKVFSFSVIVFLLSIIIVTIVITKLFCKSVPVFSIIIENLLLFTLVAIVEIIFFLKIASKFVPIPPSLLINTVIETIRDNFK